MFGTPRLVDSDTDPDLEGFYNLIGTDAAGADLDASYGSVVNGFNFLKVRVPGTPGLVVSMADVISEARPFAANFTYF